MSCTSIPYISICNNFTTIAILLVCLLLTTIITTTTTTTNAFIIPIQYQHQHQHQQCNTYSSFSTELYPNYPASKSTIHPAPKFRFKDTVTTRLPSPNVPINTVDVDIDIDIADMVDTSSSSTTNGNFINNSDNNSMTTTTTTTSTSSTPVPGNEIHPVKSFRFKRIVNKIFRRTGNGN